MKAVKHNIVFILWDVNVVQVVQESEQLYLKDQTELAKLFFYKILYK